MAPGRATSINRPRRIEIRKSVSFVIGIEPRDEECAKKLAKRTLTNLYNEYPEWLYHAHTRLDAAVAFAYGWNDLIKILREADAGGFYDFQTGAYAQVECAPEGFDIIRAQFDREVDEEILERLLALNLERTAAEKKSAAAPKKRGSRARTADEMV